MAKVCDICGYVYDPEAGDAFEDLPKDWVCPTCGADLDMFVDE